MCADLIDALEEVCEGTHKEDLDMDLAVKMMFNYDTESNATAIFQAMQNEAIPSRLADEQQQMDSWQNGLVVYFLIIKCHAKGYCGINCNQKCILP